MKNIPSTEQGNKNGTVQDLDKYEKKELNYIYRKQLNGRSLKSN